MDAADLKVFQMVAHRGGMNKAASDLNMVQSNVTARIRLLEDELGCALFERHSRGVSLTASGRRLLPYASRIGELVVEAAQAARDDGTPAGGLTLGALETTMALRLSPLLARYVAAWPDVDLVLRTGTTADLIQAVLAREVEGAFVCGPVANESLAVSDVFREELALLAPPGVSTLEAALSSSDIRIVVLKAGCSYRQRLEDILARRGIAVPRILEFGTLEAIGRCVSAGLGITLLPRHLVGTIWPDGAVSVHSIGRAEAQVRTLLVRRRDGYCSSAMKAFLALCSEGGSEPRQRSSSAATSSAMDREAVSPGDSMP